MNNDALPLYKQVIPEPARIQIDDPRYELLRTIPQKETDESDGTVFVYLTISDNKDYFITFVERPIAEYYEDDEYLSPEIQVQTFMYEGDRVIWLSGFIVVL